MLAAPRRSGIIAGYWVAAVTRAMFNVLLITAVALIAGLEIPGGPLDLLGLYTLALIVNAAAMLFGSGVAMRLRTMQAGPAMQVPAFLFLFLAPVWVPYDLLAGWVHAAATVNPITLVLEAGRGFIAADPVKVLPAFAVALGLAGTSVLWARGGLRSAERAA
jgi:ABC-2 type transport system permease protein